MARTTYVYREGQLWERGTEPPLPRGPRSSLPCPAIRPDGMDAIRSHADGKMYDGKGAYYRSVKEAGCEIIGDDQGAFERATTPREYTPHGNIGQDIKKAIEELS